MGPPQLLTSNEIFRLLEYLASVRWLGSLFRCSNLALLWNLWLYIAFNVKSISTICIVIVLYVYIISCWKVEKGELVQWRCSIVCQAPERRTYGVPLVSSLEFLDTDSVFLGNREASPPDLHKSLAVYRCLPKRQLQAYAGMQDLTVGLVGGTLSWARCHSVRMCVDGTQNMYTLVRPLVVSFCLGYVWLYCIWSVHRSFHHWTWRHLQLWQMKWQGTQSTLQTVLARRLTASH